MNELSQAIDSIDGFDTSTIEDRVRRPPNAFMIFGQQYRKVLAQKYDNLSNKQISKMLGYEWKIMNPVDKQHYHDLARQAYKEHLAKHPDYHYNPLEARQRKAERKRKFKTVRVCPKSKTNSHPNVLVIRPFGGNRTNLPPNATTVHYVQPIVNNNSQNENSVIGLKRAFGSANKSSIVAPIAHIEHNYAVQPKDETNIESNDQNISFDFIQEKPIESTEDKSRDNVNAFDDQSMDSIEWSQTTFDQMLANFLPPMQNPNTNVIPIDSTDNQLMNEQIRVELNDNQLIQSGQQYNDIMGDNSHIATQLNYSDALGADGDHFGDHLDTKAVNELAQQLFY